MIWLELLVVLVCIFVGARLGGISLGTVAGIGLVVLVFVFGLPPGMPPRTVLEMILVGQLAGRRRGHVEGTGAQR